MTDASETAARAGIAEPQCQPRRRRRFATTRIVTLGSPNWPLVIATEAALLALIIAGIL